MEKEGYKCPDCGKYMGYQYVIIVSDHGWICPECADKMKKEKKASDIQLNIPGLVFSGFY